MPTAQGESPKNLSPLYRAWEKHYEAKGCHPVKAREVAFRKVHTQGCRLMPPGVR